MTHAQFLRIKKLTGDTIILRAAKHNLREIAAEIGADSHIDAARIAANVVLFGPGTAAAVARMAQALMDEGGVKTLKRTAVRGLELIFSLPPDTAADQRQFFSDALRWAEEHFGVPILSATIHNDEAAPHCHVILLPLVNGHMVGSDLMGGRAKLHAMQAAFHAKVGHRHGLTRNTPQKRGSAAARAAAMELAFKVLEANSGLNSTVLRALLEPHASNPGPLLMALGLPMPTPRVSGSFVATMTKPTNKDNAIGQRPHNHIGIGDVDIPKNELSLSSVGKQVPALTSSLTAKPLTTTASTCETAARKTGSEPPQAGQPATIDTGEPADRFTRERDDDRCASEWNSELGEWSTPAPVRLSNRAIAAEQVRMLLSGIQCDTSGENPRAKHGTARPAVK